MNVMNVYMYMYNQLYSCICIYIYICILLDVLHGNPALPPVARDHGFAIEHPSNGDGSIAAGNRQCLIMGSHHRPGGKRGTLGGFQRLLHPFGR